MFDLFGEKIDRIKKMSRRANREKEINGFAKRNGLFVWLKDRQDKEDVAQG